MFKNKEKTVAKHAIDVFYGPEIKLRDKIYKNWKVILEEIKRAGRRGMTVDQIMNLRRSRNLIELHQCGSCHDQSGCGWTIGKELERLSREEILLKKIVKGVSIYMTI